MINVGSFQPYSSISGIIDSVTDKIEYELNNKNLYPHLDGINIHFNIALLDYDNITISYIRARNVIRVFLNIPYDITIGIMDKEGYDAAAMYIYNRFLKGLNKIDLTRKRWANPAPRKKKTIEKSEVII